jgi:hypothetical protein
MILRRTGPGLEIEPGEPSVDGRQRLLVYIVELQIREGLFPAAKPATDGKAALSF